MQMSAENCRLVLFLQDKINLCKTGYPSILHITLFPIICDHCISLKKVPASRTWENCSDRSKPFPTTTSYKDTIPKRVPPPSKSGNRYIDCLVRDLANSVTGTTPFPPADPQQKPSTFFQFTPEIIMRLNCGRLSFRNFSIYPNRKCTGFLLVSISMQQPTRLWLRAGAVLG